MNIPKRRYVVQILTSLVGVAAVLDFSVWPLSAAGWADSYEQGLALYRRSEFSAAISKFEHAVAEDALSAKAKRVDGVFQRDYFPFFYLSESYLAVGDLEGARMNAEVARRQPLSTALLLRLNATIEELTRLENSKTSNGVPMSLLSQLSMAVRRHEYTDALGLIDAMASAERVEYTDRNLQVHRLEVEGMLSDELVDRAADLEAHGHTLDANRLYTEAEAVRHSSAAAAGVRQTTAILERQIADALASARSVAERPMDDVTQTNRRTREAIAILLDARRYDTSRSLVNYNLALLYSQIGEYSIAIQYIDESLSVLPEGALRRDLEFLRLAAVTPEVWPSLPSNVSRRLEEINRQLVLTDGDFFTAGTPAAAALRKDPCALLLSSPDLPEQPSVIFNQARCFERKGRFDEALRKFDTYIEKTPRALDSRVVTARLSELASLTGLFGSAGVEVRAEFASASTFFDAGRYDLTFAALHRAEKTMPDYPATKFKLALLYRDFSDVAVAAKYFDAYLALERDPELRARALGERELLKLGRAKYDKLVSDARLALDAVIKSYLAIQPSLRRDELNDISRQIVQDLRQALAIFPFGVDAHLVFGVFCEISGSIELARYSFDIVWSMGRPVPFFTDDRHRIDILPGRYRSTSLTATADIFTEYLQETSPTSLERVQTKENALLMTDKVGETESVRPSRFALPLSVKGPRARTHSNQIARLFVRYGGVESVVFGKESLTFKEMTVIGFDAMSVAMTVYNVALSSQVNNIVQGISNVAATFEQLQYLYYMISEIKQLLSGTRDELFLGPLKIMPGRSLQLRIILSL